MFADAGVLVKYLLRREQWDLARQGELEGKAQDPVRWKDKIMTPKCLLASFTCVLLHV